MESKETTPSKIIEAPVAQPFIDVVGIFTGVIANNLAMNGFQVKGKDGWLEVNFNGRTVIITVEDNE